MSLINDALKKAKQAQANAPVRESAPQLRSPETDHPVRTGPSLMLPVIVLGAGLVGAALVWIAMSGRKPDAQKAEPVAAVNPQSPRTEQLVAPAAREVAPLPTVAPVPASTPEPKPAVATPPPAMVTPPAPVLPKLNGIFFNPTRPTAILNGKLVSLNSRVGEFTVLAITQTSVTLVGGSQTNVLSLSE